MKFSIITPVYNAEKYIRECIESVINQSYTDWEFILVDDGSTDSCGEICDEYGTHDSRITVVHSENQGGYKARLLGNKYITGDYVIGLDADDIYEPDLLEKLDLTIKEYGTDMILFGRSELNSLGKKVVIPFGYKTNYVYSKEEILGAVIVNRDHALWDKAIKADIYKNAKYIETERKLVLDDDYLQMVPIVNGVQTAVAIDDALYIYRLDDASKSHIVREENIIDADWVNAKILHYFRQQSLFNDKLFDELMLSYCKTVYPRLKELINSRNIFTFIKSELNALEFMKIVAENSKRLHLKRKERILYKYASKGHIFWGVVLRKVI